VRPRFSVGLDAPGRTHDGRAHDVRLLLALPRHISRRIVAALHAQGARFRFVSRELADAFTAGFPEVASRITVEPSPIDLGRPRDRDAARRSLRIPNDVRLCVVVGRVVRDKRIDTALRAATLLDALTVVVIGDGPELTALRELFPDVSFTGRLPRDQALDFIAAAAA